MKCTHRPMSNGWSGGTTSAPTTWCGRCKANVEVDAQWAHDYYDRKVQRATASHENGLRRDLAAIEQDRQYLLRQIGT